MKYAIINCYGHEYKVRPTIKTYSSNGTLAIELITDEGEPFATLTVNLPDEAFVCTGTRAFVDTNNCPWAVEMLRETGWGKPTGYYGHSGFCIYPLYEFSEVLFAIED